MRSRTSRVLAVVGMVWAVPCVVLAQGPPVMPAVTFPVDQASVATVIAAAGATILLLSFSTAIGFVLVRKLFRRLKGAV